MSLQKLAELAQQFGAVRIDHEPLSAMQYCIAVDVKTSDAEADDDGFTGLGYGVSLAEAIDEAHRLAPIV